MLLNTLFNTRPIVLHAPCIEHEAENSRKIFLNIKNKFLSCPPATCVPDNYTLITWNTKETSHLQDSLDHLGVDYHLLSYPQDEWINTKKIDLTYNFLDKVETKYLIGIDALDAIVLDDPQKIVDRFKSKDCKMLFNATVVSYPDYREDSKISQLVDRSCTRIEDIEFHKNIKINSPFKYLNAGAWIADTDFCKKFYKRVLEKDALLREIFEVNPEEQFQDYIESEQLRIRLAAVTFDEVEIDYKCEIFQLMNCDNFYKRNNYKFKLISNSKIF